MKYIGYALLFILFIYFVFVKPYIILYKVELKLEGPEINLKERSFGLKELLFFIPNLGNKTYFLRLKDLILYENQLKVKEVSIIIVSLKTTEKPFDYDFTNLTKFLNRLNISLDKAYISVNSPPSSKSITVFVGNTHLNNRKLLAESGAVAYYIRRGKSDKVEVLVKEAYLNGPIFNLVSAEVIGEKYFFNLNGSWRGRKGNFIATGFIKESSGRAYSIDPINIKAKGYIDYTSIKADLELQTDNLKIKDKFYTDLKGSGKYTYVLGKKNQISLSLDGNGIRGNLEYDFDNGTLKLALDRLAIDESLFSVERKISGFFSGNVFANLIEKNIKLDGNIQSLSVDNINLKTARVKLEARYGQGEEGEIEFTSEMFYIKGRFDGRDFIGKLSVKGFPYWDDRLSATIFYEGDLSYLKGDLQTTGDGSALNIFVYGRKMGNLTFNLSLKNSGYQIVGKGNGFQVSGEGTITERVFRGKVDLEGFSWKEKDLEVSDVIGQIFIQVDGQKVNLNGKLEGRAKSEGLELQTLSEFYLNRLDGKLGGEFVSELKNVKYRDFELKNGLLRGMIKDEDVTFSYTIEEKLKGSGKVSLRDFSFHTQGKWQGEIKGSLLRLSYALQGAGSKFIKGSIKGEAEIRGFLVPIYASLEIREGKINASFREFRTQKGILIVDFGKIDLEDGKLNFGGASVKLNSEEIIMLSPAEGSFDLKTRKAEIPAINIQGYAYGQARILYSSTSGFNLVSEGSIDLGKSSKLIRSKTQTTLIGNLYYYINTDGTKLNIALLSKEPIELRSRYLGTPFLGNAYFFGDGSIFKGSVNFTWNGSSFKIEAQGTERKLTADFSLDRIPIIYNDANLKGNVLLRGKGYLETDYQNFRLTSELSLGGIVLVRSFPKQKKDRKEEFRERITLDLKISSYESLRVYLPEGYIYGFLDGYIKGKLNDPDYKIKFSLSGGELRYFNRKFHVKSGSYEFGKKEDEINLTIASSLPEYVALIDLKGNPDYPKVLLRSEPPKEPRQILADLISGGGRAEGLISLGDVLASQIPQMGALAKGLERTLGTEVSISVSPQIGSSVEVGVSTKISKDITDRLSMEYQQSSLKDPRKSYVGGEAKISSGTSIGGRINSDRSKEVKLRIRGKFGF